MSITETTDGDGRTSATRRALLLAGAGAMTLPLLTACGKSSSAASTTTAAAAQFGEDRSDTKALDAKAARKRLMDGNERFMSGKPTRPDQTTARRKKLNSGQKPFAVVLSCADSRVPPEILFDQGLGDLFVVRSAGQVVDDAVLGSIQYALDHIGVPLLVVLGHSNCGAVKSTIEAIAKKSKPTGTALDTIVAAITPSVMAAKADGVKGEEALLSAAVDHNVERVIEQLSGSKELSTAIRGRKTRVAGATYELATGEAAFMI